MEIVETRYFQMWVNFGGMAVFFKKKFSGNPFFRDPVFDDPSTLYSYSPNVGIFVIK